MKTTNGELARRLLGSGPRSCVACERPLGVGLGQCPYCGESVPLPPATRLLRLLLPIAVACLLAGAMAPVDRTEQTAQLLRRAASRPFGALLLALALATTLAPRSGQGCLPGAPLPHAPRRTALKALEQSLLGAAAALAGLLIGLDGAAHPWAPLLAWLSLLPLPRMYGLAWTSLLAGPLVWLATCCTMG